MPGEQPGVVCLALAILGAQQLTSQPFVITAPVSGTDGGDDRRERFRSAATGAHSNVLRELLQHMGSRFAARLSTGRAKNLGREHRRRLEPALVEKLTCTRAGQDQVHVAARKFSQGFGAASVSTIAANLCDFLLCELADLGQDRPIAQAIIEPERTAPERLGVVATELVRVGNESRTSRQ